MLRNLLNVKHHAPCEISDLKYQIIKILEIAFKIWTAFLDQAISNFDSSHILRLQFPISRASRSPSLSLSNFTLVNWNPCSTEPSSWFSLVSLFCPTPFNHTPPKVLNMPNHMASKANKVSYQAVCR